MRTTPTVVAARSQPELADSCRFWLGVVSQAHVMREVAGGFAQVCHGREAPLRRMHAGDWLVYYSPATEKAGGRRVQSFTALGEVLDEQTYPFDAGDGWVPFRRNVRYQAVRPVALASLSDRLQLTALPNWGMALRRGHLPLDPRDFAIIAEAMGAPPRLAVVRG